ncbi:MAG: class I SAM-dependent methyltransferase [Candidatus Scalindua sp.]
MKEYKMTRSPTWQYDEMKHAGKDYNNISEVEAYDVRHSKFRDVKKENELILNALSVRKHDVIIEFGTGTGSFAIQAAQYCSKVYAVDVSRAMLDYAKNKAISNEITNIVFCHGGFLTYSHDEGPVDIIVTSTALHHLPDIWKAVALLKMNCMLKKGGKLFLSDVVFSYDNYEENITRWLARSDSNFGGDLCLQ